jgi:hypothetical protein
MRLEMRAEIRRAPQQQRTRMAVFNGEAGAFPTPSKLDQRSTIGTPLKASRSALAGQR